MRFFVDDPREPTVAHPYRDPETGRDFLESMDIRLAWKFYDLVERWGIDQALEMAVSCAAIVKHDLTQDDIDHLRWWLTSRHSAIAMFDGDRATLALEITHHFLYKGDLKTWKQAAELARQIIGREEAIQPETWRKRMERYAEKRGYPKIELYPRRQAESSDNV
jgi:hypothetical protein